MLTKRLLILLSTLIVVSISAAVFLERERFNISFPEAQSEKIYGIYIGNVPMWAEVADTEKKRKTGLSGREPLKEGQGMLFIFDKEGKHGIWMKDMNFPIDIAWIDARFNIVDIKSNVEPESYPEVFYPAQESLYVIESMAGFLRANDIKIGDKAVLKIF